MPELVFRPFALDERPEVEVIDVVIFVCCQYIASFFSGPGELVPDLPGSPIPSAGEIVPIVVVSFFLR